MKRTDPARIFERIVISESGCWLYQRGLSGKGYGIISIKDRAVQAHRVAYELRRGPIPEGLCVLHKCDVPRCINPDHLFLGTLGENNTDREQKGRSADRKGEANTRSKLTNEQIVSIIRDCEGELSQAAVGRKYGISQQTVSKIVRRLRWAHVPA